jgi:hypothetical protein
MLNGCGNICFQSSECLFNVRDQWSIGYTPYLVDWRTILGDNFSLNCQ